MTEQDVHRHIRSANLLPVYFLYGEEDFLIERTLTALKTAALGDGDPSFNLDVFYGSEHKGEDVVAAANAFPVLSERRIVVLKEADKLKTNHALASYVRSPAAETVLLLCSETAGSGRKRGGGTKRQKAVDLLAAVATAEKQGHAASVEFKPLKDAAALKWITDEFRASGKRVTPEACTVFHALKGNSARELSSEVEKILSAVGDREEISVDDIYTHLGASRQYNIFELSNSVLARDTKRAVEIGLHILSTESLPAIVAVLTRQYTSLWRLRSLSIKGRCTDEQARSIGMAFGWQADNLRAYLPKYPDPSYFERCFEYLLNTDVLVKTRSVNDAVVLTRLIHQLTAQSSEQPNI